MGPGGDGGGARPAEAGAQVELQEATGQQRAQASPGHRGGHQPGSAALRDQRGKNRCASICLFNVGPAPQTMCQH